MTNLKDVLYIAGNFYTYEYVFKSKDGKEQVEFIHCILKERLNEVGEFAPKEIRIDQIHNLEKFDSGEYTEDDFSSRILKTDNIRKALF